jgi:putative ABC transport system permease protein
MTHDGLNRMLNLESILCSAKSLIVGLPLGALASYLVYQSMMQSVDFSYELPWLAVVQSVVAVFVITWVTMRYSASRLRGKNIVETIRSESGI